MGIFPSTTYLTEAEAKTKWCPMARIVLDYGDYASSGNRGWADETDFLHIDSRCIGSACMMWRQGIKRNPDWQPRHQMIAYSPTHPDDEPDPYVTDSERGYCGIAGREGLL